MHAVLGVDLQARIEAVDVAHDFIDTRGAIALLRRIVERQIHLDGDRGVLQLEMDRLVFLVIGRREKDR